MNIKTRMTCIQSMINSRDLTSLSVDVEYLLTQSQCVVKRATDTNWLDRIISRLPRQSLRHDVIDGVASYQNNNHY